ncbi:response regulator transcription factor [Facklamia sp. DSM 111018]|uniref:Response regulator transcription factor n=1 Tax=Facklamia lactis TaxID=2749967 RepID=A0ABS0LSY4_9LACT|nr:response regulator transcription factor [Facklamia lactis]MBG9980751.1 response regulator transcription factor [Facklamia lactis]MBG9986565.1 response regulator transcription factor [Facklamia lactis]
MRILVVDDDPIVTGGIKTILEVASQSYSVPFQVIGLGHNGQDAIDLYSQLKPDILLMDIRMPVMDGICAGKMILKADPEAKIIFLTTFLEDDYIVSALQIGAKGYMMKTDYESLMPALEAVSNGQRVFGDEIIAKIPHYLSSQESRIKKTLANFSDKEITLIQGVAEGLNNKELATSMHFSEGTIRNYLSLILEKLNLRDRTQLAIYYYKYMQDE